MKVYVHIGAHKTGTTSIQHYFSGHSAELAETGFLYPVGWNSYNPEINHTDLTIGMLIDKERLGRTVKERVEKSGLSYSDYFESYMSFLRDQIDILKPETLFLSSEAFFAGAGLYDWEKLAGFLGVGLSDFNFVVYLRDPASHYLSLVQQRIKFSSSFKRPSPVAFRSVIESYERLAPGRVVVRILELAGDTTSDIVNILDIKCKCLGKTNDRRNESMSAEAMSALQEFRHLYLKNRDNRIDDFGRKLLSIFVRADKIVGGKGRPELHDDVRSFINYKAKDDIGWLQENYEIGVPWIIGGDHGSLQAETVEDICVVDVKRKTLVLQEALAQLLLSKY